MNDMRAVIVPKSDQMNADDLLGGPISVTISKVEIQPGTEQPVSIHFDGDNGKPYKPCKSMCRVLVNMWGPDATNYLGRGLTLYADPAVLWGGMKVGGIRISHMTDIAEAHTMALTATKGSRKPFTVKPLARAQTKPAAETASDLRAAAEAEAAKGVAAYQAFWKSITREQQRSLLPHHEALKAAARDASALDDPFGLPPVSGAPHDLDTGEIHADQNSPAAGGNTADAQSSERAPAPGKTEEAKLARDEDFWAADDLEIPAPRHDEKKPDWHGWGARMVALIEVAKAGEIDVLRSHNATSRQRCLAAADPKIVSDVDRAFAAAEKRSS